MDDFELLKSKVDVLADEIQKFNDDFDYKVKSAKEEINRKSNEIINDNNIDLERLENEIDFFNQHLQHIEEVKKEFNPPLKRNEKKDNFTNRIVEANSKSEFGNIGKTKNENSVFNIETNIIKNAQEAIISYDLGENIKKDLANYDIKAINDEVIRDLEQNQFNSSDLDESIRLSVNHSQVKNKMKTKKSKIIKVDFNNILAKKAKSNLDTYIKAHTFNWDKIIGNIYNSYEDYLAAFYRIYISLDDIDKNNEINSILTSINKYYQTNYISLNDLLAQNNFSSLDELGAYSEEFNNSQIERRG